MSHLSQGEAPPLTQKRLMEVLEYNECDGLFRRRVAVSNTKVGDVAGTPDRKGYTIIRVDAVMYRAHRLAFLYMTGGWPAEQVDHVNRVKSDNRWVNLRCADANVNAQNHVSPRSDNKAGYRGVCWRKSSKCFVAQIQRDGKRKCLGYFKSAEEAYAAYCRAREKYHSGFVYDEVCA